MLQEHTNLQESTDDSHLGHSPDQNEERVGQTFRRIREHYGENQRTVAAALKISVDQLDYLEKGTYTLLPGRVYILGWARAYANYLSLDIDDVLSRLKKELAQESCPSPTQAEHFWAERFRSIEKGPPQWSLALASAIGLAMLYGIFAFWNTDEPSYNEPGLVNSTSLQTQEKLDTSDKDKEENPRSSASLNDNENQEEATSSTPSLEFGTADNLGASVRPSEEEKAVANLTQAGEAYPERSDDPNILVERLSSSRIRLSARTPSWISIRDTVNQRTFLTQIIKKGDRVDIPPLSGLIMTTGNAGGLIIEVDGREIPALGPQGSVRRNIILDPDKLILGRAYIPPLERGLRTDKQDDTIETSTSETNKVNSTNSDLISKNADTIVKPEADPSIVDSDS